MIILYIIIALLLGILAGTFTGLIPGIHINLVSIMVISISSFLLKFADAVVIGVFVIAMSVTHTFLDSIPSIYLGAPDEDTAVAVLPGHKMLLEGMGHEAVKLTVIGSLLCIIISALLFPLFLLVFPMIYSMIKDYIGEILLFVVVYMILKDRKLNTIFWNLVIFLLAGICKKVYIIVRRDELRASKAMQKRVFNTENIEVLWKHQTIDVTGDQVVTGLDLVKNKGEAGEEKVKIDIDGFFLAIGHTPNSDVFKDFVDTDDTGYVQTVPGSAKTNVPGIFACGDLQDNTYRQAVTAAGSGCMAALDAERYLGEME